MIFYTTLLTLILTTLILPTVCSREDSFPEIFNEDYISTFQNLTDRFSDLAEESKIFSYQNLPPPFQKRAILSLHKKLADTLPQLISYRKKKNTCKRSHLQRSHTQKNLALKISKLQYRITNLQTSLSIQTIDYQESDTNTQNYLEYCKMWVKWVKKNFLLQIYNFHWGILKILIGVNGLD